MNMDDHEAMRKWYDDDTPIQYVSRVAAYALGEVKALLDEHAEAIREANPQAVGNLDNLVEAVAFAHHQGLLLYVNRTRPEGEYGGAVSVNPETGKATVHGTGPVADMLREVTSSQS